MFAAVTWGASQVERVCFLLGCMQPALPSPCDAVVLANRGIGTSPNLFKALDQCGWRVLFRITDHAKIQRADEETWTCLRELGMYNPCHCCHGRVFKKRGQVQATIRLYWEAEHGGPWCLLSNDASLDPQLYKQRWWIEAMFRD